MSQENVEIVRRAASVQGDPEKFLELLDPHIVLINAASAAETKPFIGYEGVRQWAVGFMTSLRDFRIEATEIIDAGGDQVVGVGRLYGTGVRSGAPVEREISGLITFVNGKVVRCQGFDTRAEALEAAGLSELGRTMSEKNVERIRRMLAKWQAGDFDGALEFFDPDIVWDNGNAPEGWITHGTDEMQVALRTWIGTWTEYAATFDEYIDGGAHVIVVGREQGRAKSSGIEVDQPSVVLYTLREGKIVLAKNYAGREAALEAAGLSD